MSFHALRAGECLKTTRSLSVVLSASLRMHHCLKVDPDLRGFSGGFLHDSKAYFVPSHNGRGAGAKFVRVDASNFSSNSVEVCNFNG